MNELIELGYIVKETRGFSGENAEAAPVHTATT